MRSITNSKPEGAHHALHALALDGRERLQGKTIYRGRECAACLNTGYKGRTGIFEVMVMNKHIKGLVLRTSDAGQIKAEAMKHGMATLGHDGIHKVLQGITSLEEIIRVTQ